MHASLRTASRQRPYYRYRPAVACATIHPLFQGRHSLSSATTPQRLSYLEWRHRYFDFHQSTTSLSPQTLLRFSSRASNDESPKGRRTTSLDALWHEKYQRLMDFQKQHGHTNVPRNHADDKSLATWVQKQRQNYHAEALSEERTHLLQSMDFQWRVDKHNHQQWKDMFAQLQQFQEKYESTKVPIVDSKQQQKIEDPISRLGRWVKDQRHYYNKRKNQNSPMTDERIELLESIDFAWSGRRNSDYERWLHKYFQWKYIVEQNHGSSFESLSATDGQYDSLHKWMEKQRKEYHGGKLDEKRIELLQEIDFDFGDAPTKVASITASFDKQFEDLRQYKERFGSTLVCSHVNPQLGKFTTSLRQAYRKGTLPQDQIDKLQQQLQFDFEASDVSWNAMADRLAAFQREHGTTVVPSHYGQDRPLAHWVTRQRGQYGKYVEKNDDQNDYDSLVQRIAEDVGAVSTTQGSAGYFRKLSPEIVAGRITRLIDMGFVWDPLEQQWMDVYERLVEYQQHYQSTTVPKQYAPDPQLGEWVQKQRKLYNAKKLSQERIDRLNEIDFIWDPQEVQWQGLFERLKAYEQLHGNTSVPSNYDDDTELGNWVATQRRLYKTNALAADRVSCLESLGFVWTVQASKEALEDDEKAA